MFTTYVWQVALFPEASVAVTVTRVFPIGKVDNASLVMIGLSSTASDTLTFRLSGASTTSGHVGFGGVVSSIVTYDSHSAVFPDSSFATKVILVFPRLNLPGESLILRRKDQIDKRAVPKERCTATNNYTKIRKV